MSRIGKQPVVLPAGVKVRLAEGKVFVEGPKGKLDFVPHRLIKVEVDEATKALKVTSTKPEQSMPRVVSPPRR